MRRSQPPVDPDLIVRIDGKYLGGWSLIEQAYRPVIIRAYVDGWEFTDGGGGWKPRALATLAASDIAGIDLSPMSAQHARGYSLAMGFVGSGQQVGGTVAMRVVLVTGEIMVIEIAGPLVMAETGLAGLLCRFPPMSRGSWHPDPTGRNELRYYDGSNWTDHVSNSGSSSVDPAG